MPDRSPGSRFRFLIRAAVSLCSLLIASGACRSEKEDRVWPELLCHDIGEMDAGRELSHVFELTNDGDPLRITEILPCPDCTARLLSDADIGRGEKAMVELEMETAGRGEEVRAAAVLRSDDPFRPRTRLVLSAQVRGAVHASPGALHFGQTIAGRLANRTLDIVMPPDEGWKVTAAESSSEHVSVEALGGDGGPDRRYRIALRHPEPVGDWSSVLVIRCERERESLDLRVPLS
ncbi:MAG: DUF1573 domain-containing protein, partial [Polyangia bacterium]